MKRFLKYSERHIVSGDPSLRPGSECGTKCERNIQRPFTAEFLSEEPAELNGKRLE